MEELVKVQNGKALTNSVLVAKKFMKPHRTVLRNIRNVMTTAQNCAVLPHFIESTYYNDQNKLQPMYLMDRDGFSLLVMGFTGKPAMQFKMDFIRAFNEMETRLKSHSQSEIAQAKDPEELLLQSVQLMIEQKKRIHAVEQRLNRIEAKTITRPDYFTVAGLASVLNIPINLATAKLIGLKATKLCHELGLPLDSIPDPRFGRVNMYPRIQLIEAFEQTI